MPLNSPIELPASGTENTPKSKYDPTAGWLSFMMPGLGQVYQGAYARGITLFIAFTLVACFRDGRIFLPVAALLAGFEAYRPKTKKEHWSIWEKAFSGTWSRLLRGESRPQPWRKTLFSIAGIVGFLCWFFMFAPSVYPFEAQAELNDTVDVLADRVRDYRVTKGKFPESLQETLRAGETSERIKDPWGEAILLRPVDDGFELVSKGRDRTENTRDDFKYRFR